MIDRPVVALQKVGGTEIAALVGAILEASDNNIAVLVDGFIVTTAAMIACQMNPNASRVLFFATKSTEQGQTVAMETIQNIASDNQVPAPTKPALDMHLRMGEGTGALMAVPLIKSAVTVLSNLATLDEVLNLASEKEDDPVC
uniref:Nicotinate-nucleotide--dimethylbenzimidazole phosphoribosyltransferase n=1 Tax=Corethron hystrix TaxID=216773 RepID=A0A7S1C230_9STRA